MNTTTTTTTANIQPADNGQELAARINAVPAIRWAEAADFVGRPAYGLDKVKERSARDWAATCFEAGQGWRAALDQKITDCLSALGAGWRVNVTAKGRENVSRFGLVFERDLTETEAAAAAAAKPKAGRPRKALRYAVIVPGRREILEAESWNAAEACRDTFHLAHGRAWARPFVRPIRAAEMVVTETNGGKAHKDKDGNARTQAHKVTRIGWMPEGWMEWKG